MANDNQPQAVSSSFWDRVEGISSNPATSSGAAADSSNAVMANPPAQPQPGVSHSFWDRVEGKTPSQIQQSSQTSTAKAQAPSSAFDKIHKGLEQGVADGFGLTAQDDDPHKLSLMDMMGQTWSNLKRSAIHSYENLG